MPQALSPQEALVFAMMTTAAVDRRITGDELSRIGSIVHQLPIFRGRDDAWLTKEAQECGKVLSREGGLDEVLELIATALPAHLHETAYALSTEVAATDLKVKLEEVRFLELLAEKLKLDKLIVSALERAAKARHQQV